MPTSGYQAVTNTSAIVASIIGTSENSLLAHSLNDSNEEVYAWLVDADDTATAYGKSYYNSDYAIIGNCLQPFLRRGGLWWSGTVAGVFASNGCYGYADAHCGFRPVVVAE